jgi:peroxiredoxin
MVATMPAFVRAASPGELEELGLVLAIEGGAVIVAEIEPDGAAHQAGMRKGDRILRIDGVEIGEPTLEQVSARFQAERRDALNLVVRRRSGGQQELWVRRPRSRGRARDNLGAPPAPTLDDDFPSTTRSGRKGIPGPQSQGRTEVIRMAAVAVGDTAVDFTLPRLGGGEVNLSDFKGKPVFLDFWATWCGPCVEEAPALGELYKQYGEDVQMLGISLDYRPAAPTEFISRFGLVYPHLITQGWEDPVVQSYGVHRTGIPFNVLIDQDGRVAALDLHGEPLARAMEILVRRD